MIDGLTPRQRARHELADALASRGSAYRNAADSIRGGFSNMWIEAGLVAIEAAHRSPPQED